MGKDLGNSFNAQKHSAWLPSLRVTEAQVDVNDIHDSTKMTFQHNVTATINLLTT